MRRAFAVVVFLSLVAGPRLHPALADWTVTLGDSDTLAFDQPVVAVAVTNLDNSISFGPQNYNNFVLDTGSTTILAGVNASGELTSNPTFQTVATYYESGIGGSTPTQVTAPYNFSYAGSNGILTTLPNIRLLVSDQDVGFDGVAGMPLLLHHSTTLDLTPLAQFSPINVSFTAAPPAPTGSAVGHRYDVPLKLVNFPLDGQVNPTDPPPAAAPLSMAAVQVRQGAHMIESHFLIDTGAQTSFISTATAKALGIDPATDSVGVIPVQGVGGEVDIPVVDVASLGLHTTQGKDLVWTNLQLGVLDIDPSIAGIFGMDFLTSGALQNYSPDLSKVHFDFRNSDNMTGDMLLDVSPSLDVTNTSDHSGSWDFAGSGNFSDATKWYSPAVPSGAGVTVMFGNGILNSVTGSSAVVTIDAPQTLGGISFTNTQGTGYVLAGNAITLDNNGLGATVSVADGVTAVQQIQAPLVLADNATFTIASGSALTISVGGISETGGSRGISLTGGGTLTFAAPSSYTGGTTVNGGTLRTTGAGTIGTGFLAVNANDGAASIVSLGGNQTVTSLSGSIFGTGTARINVAAATTLTVNQANDSFFEGNLALASGATAGSGGKLAKTGPAALELDGAPSLGNNSAMNVSAGTLRLTTTADSSGAVAVGTGVTVSVSSSATLELAGSIASLSAGGNRAHVVNSSSAPAGLLVTGTNQVVGAIDGNGATQLADAASLTADHIIQAALVIGGTKDTHSNLTIAASDTHGNSLAEASSFAIAGLPNASEPLSPGLGSLGSIASGALDSSTGLLAGGQAALSGGSATVPEPATIVLLMLGGAAFFVTRRRHRER